MVCGSPGGFWLLFSFIFVFLFYCCFVLFFKEERKNSSGRVWKWGASGMSWGRGNAQNILYEQNLTEMNEQVTNYSIFFSNG